MAVLTTNGTLGRVAARRGLPDVRTFDVSRHRLADRIEAAAYADLYIERLKPVADFDHGRGDDVLHPFDVHVVQVLPRPHVTINRVILRLEHLLVKLGGDNHPHRRHSIFNFHAGTEL